MKAKMMMRRALALVFAACMVAAGARAAATHAAHNNPHVNTTKVLAEHYSLTTFNRLLSQTGVVHEIDGRSSITLLCPPNAVLDPVIKSLGDNEPLLLIADILRYHAVLQYLDIPEIKSMTNGSGILLTTLYQTTGRATGQLGFVNLTAPKTGTIHFGVPVSGAHFNTSVVKNITQFPYTISYLEVDHVLIPEGLNTPQGAAASMENVTASLQKAGNFNTLLSLLQSTGVDKALKTLDAITIFAPSDAAFSALPGGAMKALTPAQKIALLQYHTVPTYYTIGALKDLAVPVSTVASQSAGADKYVLNVSSAAGGLSLKTGVNKAVVKSTLLDQPPVAVYAVDSVLLPPEIFSVSAATPAGAPGPAPAGPAPAPSPASSPSPSPASSPSPSPSPSSSPSPSPSPSSSPSPSPSSSAAPSPSANPLSPPSPPSPDSSPNPSPGSSAAAAPSIPAAAASLASLLASISFLLYI